MFVSATWSKRYIIFFDLISICDQCVGHEDLVTGNDVWVISVFESTRKVAVCFLWLSLSGNYRITDEALLTETTLYYPSAFLWMFPLLLNELIVYFY